MINKSLHNVLIIEVNVSGTLGPAQLEDNRNILYLISQ